MTDTLTQIDQQISKLENALANPASAVRTGNSQINYKSAADIERQLSYLRQKRNAMQTDQAGVRRVGRATFSGFGG